MIQKINESETIARYDSNRMQEFRKEMEELGAEIDVVTDFELAMVRHEQYEMQAHIHPIGQTGASSLGACVFKRAWNWAGLPLPPVHGIKADTGPARVGSFWHSRIIQPILYEFYKQNPARLKLKNVEYGVEIYVKDEILPGLTVVSPVDIMYAEPPEMGKSAYEIRPIRFRYETRDCLMPRAESKIVEIFDIKSASDKFGFKHHREEGLGFHYRAQGHFYMHATKRDRIFFVFVNKNNAHFYVIRLDWDEDTWQRVLEMNQRVLDLSKILRRTKGKALVKEDDFAFFTDDSDFQCKWTCPLSETYEEENSWGNPTLEMVGPCTPCRKMAYKIAEEKFLQGTTWRRGRSHVIVEKVEDDRIYVKNKSGTEFIDSVYNALKKYKPMEE